MDSDNARLARRWFIEVWNDRREATIEELLTAHSYCHTDGGGLITGPQEFRTVMYEPFVAAFPDLKVTIDDIIVEGAKAVVRWTAHATHTGPGFGCPPTGKKVSMSGMTWLTIRDGNLVEGWQRSNIPEVLQSICG